MAFKLINKKFAISAFMMANLKVEEERWKYAYAAYRWFLSNVKNDTSSDKQLEELMRDLTCVFILHTCTATLREVVVNDNPQNAVQHFVACTIGCIQFLTPKDIVFNMSYYFMFERVMKAVKKSVNCKKTI